RTLRRKKLLKRTVLLAPPTSRKDVAARWQAALGELGLSLAPERASWFSSGRAFALAFGVDGQPFVARFESAKGDLSSLGAAGYVELLTDWVNGIVRGTNEGIWDVAFAPIREHRKPARPGTEFLPPSNSFEPPRAWGE